jgi:hypothetical protein
MEEPRLTPVVNEPLPPARTGFNFAEFFARKDRLARLALAVTLAALLATSLALLLASGQARHGVRIVVLDSAGNWMAAPGATFGEASELHVQQALLATSALFLRSPEDFDQPEILQALFSREALSQAMQLKGIEAAEFQERHLHQKPQVTRVTAIETRDERAQIEVTGELLRNGTHAEVGFTEVIPFTLRLDLRPTPDLLRAQRGHLTIVTAFEIAYESPRS